MVVFPSWQYDEMKQIGKDYASIAEVEAYDARHSKFRDIERENNEILEAIRIEPHHTIIEFGAGTGAFAVQVSARCAHVYAVDVSRPMLDYARIKAEKNGASNISYHHAGFLTYVHSAPPVDAIVTSTAFHHLPDFWKGIALRRMHDMVKPRGALFLSDVIFEPGSLVQNIEQWIVKLEKAAGPEMRKDVESHIRKEFSTYGWIMDGLIERAGFRIESKVMQEGVIGRYLCRKN